MNRLSCLLLIALLYLPVNRSAAQCTMDQLEGPMVLGCSHNAYDAGMSFVSNQPESDTFHVWLKLLPNGNNQHVGSFPYSQQGGFQLRGLLRDATYSLLVVDQEDPSCLLRDTLQPLDCEPPCMTSYLELFEYVQCHPATDQMALRFDFSESFSFSGGFLFGLYKDSTFLTDLWMAPWGEVMIDVMAGDTLVVFQRDSITCPPATFIVPECNQVACPIHALGEPVIAGCEQGTVHYSVPIAHQRPLDLPMSYLALYDDQGFYLVDITLSAADTLVDIYLPADSSDRTFFLCDLFAFPDCCMPLVVPGLDCDTVTVGVSEAAFPGMRWRPNPTRDILFIDLGSETFSSIGTPYRIADMAGREIGSGRLGQQVCEIETDRWSPGIYIVQVWDQQGRARQFRVTKVE